MNDRELLSAVGRGDAEAFRTIFMRHNRQLYAAAFNKLRDREEAKDVVQDVFANLWLKARDITLKESSLAAYLHVAVRNRILDLVSKKKYASGYLEELRNNPMQEAGRSDNLVREKQAQEIIDREIAMLPPRMREALILSRRNHLSHREIAEQMNISHQTATDQVKKALRILKIKLGHLLVLAMLALIS